MIDNYRERKRAEAQAAEVVALRTDTDAIGDALGSSGDGTTAPRNVIAGELVITGGGTYVALANIARGERLRDGANVRATTLAEYITEQSKE